jgi:Periplasmic binding protein
MNVLASLWRGLSVAALVGGVVSAALVSTEAPSVAGAATATAATCGGDLDSGTPGVTSETISVGSVSTQTGPLAGDFSSMMQGVRAYFDYVDAHGGINGRKITLAFSLDDGSDASLFSQLSRTLIDQDHVFAAVGVASPFFDPSYYVDTCTPTYGDNVIGNWAGALNLFAPGGSTLPSKQVPIEIAYLMKRKHIDRFATMASSSTAESSGICGKINTYLTGAKFTKAYTDLNVSDAADDVLRLHNSGAQLVISCMNESQNVQMADAIKVLGLKFDQFWLNGNDPDVLNKNQSVMQGIYFVVQHVPFSAPAKYYPGLTTYLTAMNQYARNFTYDELSIQGWASAALFAEGVKLAGSDLTQANVIKQTNLLTSYNAAGTYAPTNWKTAHTTAKSPYCVAYVQVQRERYVSVFGQGHDVYVCLKMNKYNLTPTRTKPGPGTPGS